MGQTATELQQQFQHKEVVSRRIGQVCNSSMNRRTLPQPNQAASTPHVKKLSIEVDREIEHGVEK